jgi:hypothetical protein
MWGSHAGRIRQAGSLPHNHPGCLVAQPSWLHRVTKEELQAGSRGQDARATTQEDHATCIVPTEAELGGGPSPCPLPPGRVGGVVYFPNDAGQLTRRELGREASSISGFGENPVEGAGLPEGGASSCRVIQCSRSRRERISGGHPAMVQLTQTQTKQAASRPRGLKPFGRVLRSLPNGADVAALNPSPAGPTDMTPGGSTPLDEGLGAGDWRR